MTWDEFKNDVDEQLRELGKDGSIELSNLDRILPELGYYVTITKDGALCLDEVDKYKGRSDKC